MLQQLTEALRTEQELLEQLLFKLIETRLLLVAGETRFVPASTREVTQFRQRTRSADLGRAALVAGMRGALPDPADPTLRQLATRAAEPWAGMLRDHHDALTGLVAEIELVAHLNARLAREGLLRLHREPQPDAASAEDPMLRGRGDPTLSMVADHSAYRSVLGSADRLRMPALLAFLR